MTSHIEKQNHTLRMHCRRLTRLTNAFSKKLENFEAAVALNFAYYNFCKYHITIKTTPACAAGLTDRAWTIADLLESCGEESRIHWTVEAGDRAPAWCLCHVAPA